MYISEIKKAYPLVYERIIAQMHSHLKEESVGMHDVNEALNWSRTKERSEFWSCVYRENWDKAMELRPHLFIGKENEEKGVIIKTNGLFE